MVDKTKEDIQIQSMIDPPPLATESLFHRKYLYMTSLRSNLWTKSL